jgi:SPOR domain
MRQLLRELAACGLLLATLPIAAAAQQGSVQVTAAAHTLHGDATRIGTQPALEPDLGVSWLRPGTRFGMFQMEIRGTTRDDQPHFGRMFVSLRDFKHRGVTYTFEAGDSFFSPARGEYQLRNLHTPAVNFSGASLKASTPRTNMGVMIGRSTASRNIFGADIETLDQGLVIARGSHKTLDRLEISGRASRIRTRDLKEFRFTIASSDQAGGGARYILMPAVHLVADASVVTYQRRGSDEQHTDGSVLAGASVLLGRGWLQVNASRFSPGELPVLAQPLADRQMLYAAGEYDIFHRIRVFGGWESFRANLEQHAMANGPPTDGSRAFGGLRIPFGSRSSAAIRIDNGDRRSRLVGAALTRISDTGVVSAELQSSFGPVSGFGRFARRENVESELQSGSYTQHEAGGLTFFNLTRNLQLFGSVTAIRNAIREGGGHTFWQFGGGTQSQVLNRGLWLRGEGLFSRNIDLLSERTVPQQTVSLGLNGEIAPNTVLALNVFADRLGMGLNEPEDSWIGRSSVRITRTFTNGPYRPTGSVLGSMARHGGTGSLVGIVYKDWNGNGLQEPGELPLENIPIRLANLGNTNTSRAGEFAFVNVPIGLQQIGVDMSSLPVDFDAPQVPQVQVELSRGDTRRLTFGLVPLGSIAGRIVHDANANGVEDQGEEPIDGAVLVLNGGARSEKARSGRFRFDAVRSGDHTLELLVDSLPDGSTIAGPGSVELEIGRESLVAETLFLVSIHVRPEIRRVFPAGEKARVAAARPPVTSPAPRTEAAASRERPGSAPLSRTAGSDVATRAGNIERFAIQVAALNDPSRAAIMVEELRAAGFPAYLVQPPSADPDAPYRVRVGSYGSRTAAEDDARVLEKRRGQKLWVIRER